MMFTAALFGLAVGSFLNVVISRLERNEGIGGRSYCPRCRHELAWHDLVPLVSFLVLRGKCRYCKGRISLQYPLVEGAAGILFAGAFWHVQPLSLLGFLELSYVWVIGSLLIALFVFDLKHFLLPDTLLMPAIVLAGGWSLFFSASFFSDLGAAAAASAFFLVPFLLSKGAWMGFGDVKFGIFMGFFLGWPAVLVALFLGVALGAVTGMSLVLLGRKGMKSEVPFGPFLIIGTVIAYVAGRALVDWYLGLLWL